MSADAFYLALKQRLKDGEWPAGQRLPSIRKFVSTADASYHAVVSACARLVSEGVLEASPGRGYFVTGRPERLTSRLEPDSMAGEPLFRLLQAGSDYTKLGCGWLPPAWRDTDLLAKAIRRTARLEQSSLAEYGEISGYLPLRKQLSLHLQRRTRIDVAPSQIITTLGATQGMDLVARLLIQPGDHVFVDEPGNGNLIKLIQLAGGHVVGIRRTESGPDIVEMQAHLARHKVRAFFCNSTFHNPTGGNITPHNAFQVLRLAVEHDFHVVEDDVYGDFSPELRQTFAELDDLQRVIYIGSFSKCLSASLRVGYIACAQALVEPLTRLKLFTSVAVPAFCERFVNTILVDGTYAGHMKQIQHKLITQQALTQHALRNRGWQFEIVPEGGMFLWADHPDLADLTELIGTLARQKVLLMPGSAFSVTRDYHRHARINCSHFTPALEAHFAV
ncbi:MAG TPA: PLP-dependent aminotransferase family protein [Pseudomonas sp.]|uniref:aminotransferase-like domain-containing protein n=1 Tax=Pseudomonas sp. TaxID=306 RepID=UPI002B493771|nr:PLP-dependent aminotransferase family protein [Pseudomonas sp.]HKS13949.1 PLP-dependent aminotransferase family protein [Pseudomonas sp.]